jgi:hypothetical protein
VLWYTTSALLAVEASLKLHTNPGGGSGKNASIRIPAVESMEKSAGKPRNVRIRQSSAMPTARSILQPPRCFLTKTQYWPIFSRHSNRRFFWGLAFCVTRKAINGVVVYLCKIRSEIRKPGLVSS